MRNALRIFRTSEWTWRPFRLFAAALLVSIALPANPAVAQGTSNPDDAERMHWAQLVGAQVKLDNKTPVHWNVYQPAKNDKKDKKDKKDSNLVLVLLGRRYLMLDVKARAVYLVMPSDLHAQGSDFDSGDLADKSKLIPSTDWNDRDVGPAELVNLTLGDYGATLEISLPHMPDLRPFY